MYAKEKRYAIPFVVSSSALFAAGAWFCFHFAFPAAFKFLLGMSGVVGEGLQVQPTVMLDEYIDFVLHMLLAFGCAAELPINNRLLSLDPGCGEPPAPDQVFPLLHRDRVRHRGRRSPCPIR